jgi:hypothetical protein
VLLAQHLQAPLLGCCWQRREGDAKGKFIDLWFLAFICDLLWHGGSLTKQSSL